jgi:uncharacterized membrane protein
MRRSGWLLALAGLIGIAFFWITDPGAGLLRSPPGSLVDAANQAVVGTLVGLLGSAAVMLVGLWLATRRSA